MSEQKAAPGWYDHEGRKRYWDGERWLAYGESKVGAAARKGLDYRLVFSIAAGIVIGWFTIWLGAQLAPEYIYWPVKFVVDESDLFGNAIQVPVG